MINTLTILSLEGSKDFQPSMIQVISKGEDRLNTISSELLLMLGDDQLRPKIPRKRYEHWLFGRGLLQSKDDLRNPKNKFLVASAVHVGYIQQIIEPPRKEEEYLDKLSEKLEVGSKIRFWERKGWTRGQVVWKWNQNDLFSIKVSGEHDVYTYHVDDPTWRMELLLPAPLTQTPILRSAPTLDVVGPDPTRFRNGIPFIPSMGKMSMKERRKLYTPAILAPHLEGTKDMTKDNWIIWRDDDEWRVLWQ